MNRRTFLSVLGALVTNAVVRFRDTQSSLTDLFLATEISESNDQGLLPNNTQALKAINRNHGSASLHVVDRLGSTHTILFTDSGVTCNQVVFGAKLGFVGLTIKNIRRDEHSHRFIIKGKLGILGKEVPMPLSNANRLVDQILQIATGASVDQEIDIPGGDGAKLVV